jgi:hypothetical protein
MPRAIFVEVRAKSFGPKKQVRTSSMHVVYSPHGYSRSRVPVGMKSFMFLDARTASFPRSRIFIFCFVHDSSYGSYDRLSL